jgi:hypothetical protein
MAPTLSAASSRGGRGRRAHSDGAGGRLGRGQVSVMSWGGPHPKRFCRGRFAGFAEPPVIRCHLIRVTVTRLPNGRKVPGPLWPWWTRHARPGPDLAGLPAPVRYRARLQARQARPGPGQGRAPRPGAGPRRTWLIAAITQLRMARPIAQDRGQRRERHRKPGKLTPGRVRRDFHRLAAQAGTPASPPKPSRAGPGRPKGRTSTPATRHAVHKKAALRHTKG